MTRANLALTIRGLAGISIATDDGLGGMSLPELEAHLDDVQASIKLLEEHVLPSLQTYALSVSSSIAFARDFEGKAISQ